MKSLLKSVKREKVMKAVKSLLILFALSLATILSGCSDTYYSGVKTGELKGRLIIEWISQDEFRYIPHPEHPLTFTRHNKEVIRPEQMLTDGGSIPRPFRFLKNYSPWGYGPAFIMHDWLFVIKQCKLEGHEKYNLEEAGTVMSEVIKTMMENPKFGGKDSLTLYSMHQAVISDIAKEYYEKGPCARSQQLFSMGRKHLQPPIARFEVSFD